MNWPVNFATLTCAFIFPAISISSCLSYSISIIRLDQGDVPNHSVSGSKPSFMYSEVPKTISSILTESDRKAAFEKE
jgi:hypothetical protein